MSGIVSIDFCGLLDCVLVPDLILCLEKVSENMQTKHPRGWQR